MEGSVSQLPTNQGDGVIFVCSHHGSWHEGRNQEISFDDGLAVQQGPFLTVARPILAALMNLDSPTNYEGGGGGKGGDQTLRWSGRC